MRKVKRILPKANLFLREKHTKMAKMSSIRVGIVCMLKIMRTIFVKTRKKEDGKKQGWWR